MKQDSGGAFELHAFRTCRRLRISRRMPLPKTPQPRIQIQAVEPIVDCGRYAVKRTVGDRVEVYATVFKDGHDTLGGAVRVRGAGREALARGAARAARQRPLGRSFGVDRPGRWQFAVAAWTDRIATWQDELRRKVEAGQEDLAGELAEGAVLFGASPDGRGRPRGGGRRPARRGRVGAARRRRRPRARALRLVVRALPALLGRLPRRGRGAAAARRARLRRRLPAADPSDRRDEPQGPQQRARRRAGRRRLAVGDRLGRGRPRRDRPRARHAGPTSTRWSRPRATRASSSRSTSRSSARPTIRG